METKSERRANENACGGVQNNRQSNVLTDRTKQKNKKPLKKAPGQPTKQGMVEIKVVRGGMKKVHIKQVLIGFLLDLLFLIWLIWLIVIIFGLLILQLPHLRLTLRSGPAG